MASLSAIGLLKVIDEELAWRVAYFFGGVLAILVVFVRLYVPESPRWLLSKGRIEEAERIVSRIEIQAGGRKSQETCQVPVFEGNILDASRIILGRYKWRFLFSASMSFTILTTYYGMITLLPVILSEVYSLSSKEIPQLLTLGSLGGLIGGLVVALLVDKVGRIPLGILISLASALLSLSFLLGFDVRLTFFLYSLIAFSFASVAYVIATEIYPSYIRAYAIGILSIIGRLSGAFSPLFLVSLSQFGFKYAMLGLASFWLVGFVAFVIWAFKGMETKGKPLEEIS